MTREEFKTTILPIKHKLFRFAVHLLKNKLEAEDVVQEILLKVWTKRQELAKVENIEAWCMRLTKNLAIDKMRSKHQKTDNIQRAFHLSSATATPYQQAEVNDTLSLVKTLIAKLPQHQQNIIHLREVEGMSYQEIADQLELSLDQVKVNLFRARKQLKSQLANTQSYGLQQHK